MVVRADVFGPVGRARRVEAGDYDVAREVEIILLKLRWVVACPAHERGECVVEGGKPGGDKGFCFRMAFVCRGVIDSTVDVGDVPCGAIGAWDSGRVVDFSHIEGVGVRNGVLLYVWHSYLRCLNAIVTSTLWPFNIFT